MVKWIKTAKFIVWFKSFFTKDRPKISKDVYYMTIAFNASRRSIDPSTLHGAVLVSKDGRILSTGYNGPIRNCDDSKIPTDRPDKYKHFLHAEENSIINYYGSYQDIEGGTLYVTGLPCTNCLRMTLQKGVTRVVYAPIWSKCLDDDDIKARDLMLEYQSKNISFEQMSMEDMKNVIKNLDETILYIQHKTGMIK